MITINKIKQFFLYLYIFYIIYTPTINENILFDKYVVLYLLMIIMLIPYIVRRDNSLLKIISKKYIIGLMVAVFASSLIFPLVKIANNVSIDSFTDLRLIQSNIINVMIVHIAIIIDHLKKREFTGRQSFELILKMGALQGLICIASFVIPSLKELSVYLYGIAGGDNSFVIESRIYGISNDYTFGTPIYHGLLAGLAVCFAIKDNRRIYLLYAALTLIAVFLNGRTGLLIFLLVAIMSIIHLYTKKGEKRKIVIALSLVIFSVILMMSFLKNISPSTYQFVNSFSEDTKNLVLKHELTGNYQVLIGDSLHFPSGWNLVFGEGYRVYDTDIESLIGFRSDIGYVNDIYMGGLLFVIILYMSIFCFLIYKTKNQKFIWLMLIIALLLADFKGEIFRSSIFMFLIIYLKMISLSFAEDKIL